MPSTAPQPAAPRAHLRVDRPDRPPRALLLHHSELIVWSSAQSRSCVLGLGRGGRPVGGIDETAGEAARLLGHRREVAR